MKKRLIAGLLTLCMFGQSAYAITVDTNVQSGAVSVSGDFTKQRSEPVSIAVFEDGKAGDPVYANQILSNSNGAYSFEFPLTADAGYYRVNAATIDENESRVIYLEDLSSFEKVESYYGLSFKENFDESFAMWDRTENYKWHLEDGQAVTAEGIGFKRLWIKDTEAYDWTDMVIKFRFMQGDIYNETSGWCGVELSHDANGNRDLVLWSKEGGFELQRKTSGSSSLGSYKAYKSYVPYDMMIKIKDNKFSLYIKEATETNYQLIGTANYTPSVGGLGFSSYNRRLYVDNVEVYDYSNANLIQESPVLLKAGKQKQLHITKSATNVSFSSSDTSVATVSQAGLVTAKAAGVTTITATVDGVTDTTKVYVPQAVSGLSLTSSSVSLLEGEAETIYANFTNKASMPENILVWKSSNEEVLKLVGEELYGRTLVANDVGTAVVTVSTLDGTQSASCTVTVKPNYEKGTQGATFKILNGAHAIHKGVLGVHHPLAGLVNTTKQYYYPEDAALFRDIGINVIRGPEGGPANVYRWRTGDLSTRPLSSGYPGMFISDSYKIPNENNIPYCYALNVTSQSVDEIVEQVKEIMKNTDEQIYLEYGNELYDGGYKDAFPTANDYVAKCREIYKAVKNLDSSIKLGIVLNTDYMTKRLGSIGYIGGWNRVIAANQDCYDAVVPHYYNLFDDQSGWTEDEMLHALNVFNKELYDEMLYHQELFPGKEIWVTEFGALFGDYHQVASVDEANRLQIYKTPGVAISNMENMLNMIKAGNVTISAYHQAIGGSGFGIAKRTDDGTGLIKLPMYHVFKKMGEFVNGYGYYFNVDPIFVNSGTQRANYIYSGLNQKYNDADAWGFGTEYGVERVVVSNHSNKDMDIRIDGYELSLEWSYGGENPLGKYLQTDEYHYDVPNLKTPKTYSENWQDEFVLGAHQMAVYKVKRVFDNKMFASLSVGDGCQSVPTNSTATVILNEAGSDVKFTMYKEGTEIASTATAVTGGYKVVPTGGYSNSANYQIKVSSAEKGYEKIFSFKTAPSNSTSSFTLSSSANSNNFVLSFSHAPNENSLNSIKLYENGELVDYQISKSSSTQYVVTPVDAFSKNAYYKLVPGNVLRASDNSMLTSVQSAEYKTAPAVDERFEGSTGLEISGGATISGGVLDFSQGEAPAVTVTNSAPSEYVLEFDFLKNGDSALSINLGNNNLIIGNVGISLNGNAVYKYVVEKGVVYTATVRTQNEDIYLSLKKYEEDEINLGKISASLTSGTVKISGQGDIKIDNVEYYKAPKMEVVCKNLAAGSAVFGLSFDGGVDMSSINNTSVTVYYNNKPVKARYTKIGENEFNIQIQGVVTTGSYDFVLSDSVKDIYGNYMTAQTVSCVPDTLSASNLFVNSAKHYIVENGVENKINTVNSGTVNSEFLMTNSENDTIDVWAVSALYSVNQDGVEVLEDIREFHEIVLYNSDKKITTQIDVPDDGKDYVVRTMFMNSAQMLTPYCIAELLN